LVADGHEQEYRNMPLDVDERRCIGVVCDYLGLTVGGEWRREQERPLEDRVRGEAVPEDRVTNGRQTAAIEVKRLMGDTVLLEYEQSLVSLRKFLVPPNGGHYTLNACIDFRLPADRAFKKRLRREIAKAARDLRPGERGAVRIPRRAQVERVSAGGPGYIFCTHNASAEEVQRVSPRLMGTYFLADEGQWEHSFVTDAGREAFLKRVQTACAATDSAGAVPLEWTEEWELLRHPLAGDPGEDEPDGVWITCATEARDLGSAVAEAVGSMVEKGLRKFAARRWAHVHILVLDNSSVLTSLDRVQDVVGGFEAAELAPLDQLLYLEGDVLTPLWLRTSRTAGL
jgi:hypothetical protein